MADLTSPPDRTPPRDEFFARAYAELRALAESVLGSDPAGRSLGPTALLHEAYLKFKPGEPGRDRAYYFAAAARAMRQVLTDRARKHAALRHGGAWGRVSLTGIDPASPAAPAPAGTSR
ncbi:MAG: hypothetical protein IT437_03915 [Phycisphaerales bacterium]|nr:hypothetical protein [Phycisphaerales bacterium]